MCLMSSGCSCVLECFVFFARPVAVGVRGTLFAPTENIPFPWWSGLLSPFLASSILTGTKRSFSRRGARGGRVFSAHQGRGAVHLRPVQPHRARVGGVHDGRPTAVLVGRGRGVRPFRPRRERHARGGTGAVVLCFSLLLLVLLARFRPPPPPRPLRGQAVRFGMFMRTKANRYRKLNSSPVFCVVWRWGGGCVCGVFGEALVVHW